MNLSQIIADKRQRWIAERDRVLLLVDQHDFAAVRPELVRWFQMNGVAIPRNDELFEIEIHKMRATATGFDMIGRATSIGWLRDRGVDI